MNVKVKLLRKYAKQPMKATNGSAGWDVYASESHKIPAKGWKKISLGIALEMPLHLCALLVKRSGMAAKQGVCGQEGLIDSDYRGEIGMTIKNNGDREYIVQAGDRIGQLLFLPNIQVQVQVVGSLQNTSRGTQGFGSTGR